MIEVKEITAFLRKERSRPITPCALAEGLSCESLPLRQPPFAHGGMESRVRDAMNRDVVSVDSHDMLERAMALMRSSSVRALPVLHDGRLVGLLTTDYIGELVMTQSALRQAQRKAQSAPRKES